MAHTRKIEGINVRDLNYNDFKLYLQELCSLAGIGHYIHETFEDGHVVSVQVDVWSENYPQNVDLIADLFLVRVLQDPSGIYMNPHYAQLRDYFNRPPRKSFLRRFLCG